MCKVDSWPYFALSIVIFTNGFNLQRPDFLQGFFPSVCRLYIYTYIYAGLDDPDTCVGVHCVTGLGRAPALVAIALIELGMKYEVSI